MVTDANDGAYIASGASAPHAAPAFVQVNAGAAGVANASRGSDNVGCSDAQAFPGKKKDPQGAWVLAFSS